jgi:methyl-accepting chemotaxis protein
VGHRHERPAEHGLGVIGRRARLSFGCERRIPYNRAPLAVSSDTLRLLVWVPLVSALGGFFVGLVPDIHTPHPWAVMILCVVTGVIGVFLGHEAQSMQRIEGESTKELRETKAELKALQAETRVDPAEHARVREQLEDAKRRADKLQAATDRVAELERELVGVRATVGQASEAAVTEAVVAPRGPGHTSGLEREVTETLAGVQGLRETAEELGGGLKGISTSVEMLASNAEESSSSILEMAAANDEVAESMFNLAASVQQTATSIEEMTFSVKEVAKNIEALSGTAEETSSAMNEMDISIQQVENNANETAQLSEEVVWAAEGGVDAINQTMEVINLIKQSAADAVAVISRLGGRIDQIGKILSVIDDVSEQTNLLALNAAIIAAQAGEHGKGFAVVADEIKDLAERSATSTKEIAEIIKSVQRESKNAVQAVQRSSKSVDDGVRVSHQAEDALKRISDAARRSTQMVREIARATVEQTKGSKQVTDAINVVATTVQQVATATAEQARGAEQIMRSAEKMKAITRHVERSTQEQTRGSRQITRAIETISEMVNQLNEAHREQVRNVGVVVERLAALDASIRRQREEISRLPA